MYEFDPSRIAKAQALASEGIAPYPAGLAVTHTAAELRSCVADFEAHTRKELGLAADAPVDLTPLGRDFVFGGRLMFKNEMGKAGFGRVLDRSDRMQVYVKRDDVGEDAFAVWKKLDLGDIVWARGSMMRTRTGELSVHVWELRLATKCVRSLPDKFHGMSDPEARQRQRYVDLFVNDDSREVFLKRSRIVSYIRRFFEDRAFIEVETPMMHVIPGGATARPFVTHHNALDLELYLRVAPELYLKRLVVGGMERVFEINRNFRNEGIDQTHNPEFTMLEFYQAWQTWEGLIELTESMIAGLVAQLFESSVVTYGKHSIDFSGPFRRARYAELVAGAMGIPEADARSMPALEAAYKVKHPRWHEENLPTTLGKWWEKIFDIDVEKTLINPTFVTHFPVEISPLARRNDEDPEIADRFELFIAGREIANGFNELNDPVDQAARFEAQARAKAGGDVEAMHFDADYIDALCFGLPPTAGEGIGIDRLVMLLTNAQSIRDVILFPTRRPAANSQAEPNDVGPDAV